jgi:hypothetical protein
MSKKFPDLKSDEEADRWLQGADSLNMISRR